jgi:hypothetical protein
MCKLEWLACGAFLVTSLDEAPQIEGVEMTTFTTCCWDTAVIIFFRKEMSLPLLKAY